MPRAPIRCESSKWLVARLMDAGYSRTEARDALLNVTFAIIQSLMQGHNTALHGLGTFHWRPYSGQSKRHPTPPGYRIKFKVSTPLDKHLWQVKPLNPLKRRNEKTEASTAMLEKMTKLRAKLKDSNNPK